MATPRFLITLDVGIGDALAVGLSAIDQIIKNDPAASGCIDVLCNGVQAQIFEHDPRIHSIIQTEKVFFPGPHVTQWLRGIHLNAEAAQLIRSLQKRCYEAVFPSVVAPGLYFRLHSRIMYPSFFELAKDFFALRRQEDVHLGTIARQMVNHYFGKTASSCMSSEEVLLYIAPGQVQQARAIVRKIKEDASLAGLESQLLVVAPDTASVVTRPPTNLLAMALADVLMKCPQVIVYILPGYTDTYASKNLLHALVPTFVGRVRLIPSDPRPALLDLVAFLDQADVFVTGDTGLMHLAAAIKRVNPDDVGTRSCSPRNCVNTVAIFGGTNPNYYGYRKRTTIVGRGRKEQMAIRPGLSKESYNLRGRNLFDHIAPKQIANAIRDIGANTSTKASI